MNATKFVVLLVFLGVVCANVGARQVEGVSKLGISIPKTAKTNGLGAELDVYGRTVASNEEYSDASAAAGAGGPSAVGSASVDKYAYGTINAEGPNAIAFSSSSASGSTTADAAAGPTSAVGSGTATGSADSNVFGATPNSP